MAADAWPKQNFWSEIFYVARWGYRPALDTASAVGRKEEKSSL